jgi:Bifunctional DNA primase/polymerase, N-terminal
MNTSVATAALNYVSRGWSVLPIRAGTKKPAVDEWKPLQARQPERDEVAHWYQAAPTSGVAIICGRVSGLVVVDVDPRNGGDETMRAYAWPATVEGITGGGGRHLFFACPAERMPAKGIFGRGVEVQAEGSYVIAPPTVHPNGTPYRWRPGHAPSEIPAAALPAFVVQALGAARRPGRVVRVPGRLTDLDVLGHCERRGLYIAPARRGAGMHYVSCPWKAEHSTSGDRTETAVFEPHEPGGPHGFKCMHASCADRAIVDLLEWLGLREARACGAQCLGRRG